MGNIYFYFHAGSKNHGCEAIVRSTANILGIRPALISFAPDEDRTYQIDEIAEVTPSHAEGKPSILEKAVCKMSEKGLHREQYGYRLRAKYECSWLKPDSVALSIGGDNYCYGAAYNYHLGALNAQMHKKGIKTVLWGCSIEPETATDAMKKDFARYDLIVARETVSFNFLQQLNPNTVLAPDPAFSLPIAGTPEKRNCVGINLSPLIQRKEARAGITMENYRGLVRYILENTDCEIALIPHVVTEDNNDSDALKELAASFPGEDRIRLVADCNCMELKREIASCRFFIGARTHATIAAYSTCVPTLVVGYSTKAKGIATDLFGTDEHYVLPVQALKRPDDLANAAAWLAEHEAQIKAHLEATMPSYIAGTAKTKEAVEKLINA